MTNVLNYFLLLCMIPRSFLLLKIHHFQNNEIAQVPPASVPTQFIKMLLTQNKLLVDKTMFIFDLIEHSGNTEFILRPPKWGKTFNLEMAQLFFDIQYDEKGNPQPWKERSIYFNGGVLPCETSEKHSKSIKLQPLEISKHTDAMQHMAAHPVLSLSFQGFGESHTNFHESTIQAIGGMIIAKKYAFLTAYCSKLDLDGISAEECQQLLKYPYEALQVVHILEHSFYILAKLLHAHSKQTVVILIDEYDYPLREIRTDNDTDYSCVKKFQFNFFSNTFKKGERLLYKGIVTGTFRDVQSSSATHSDINNVQYCNIVDKNKRYSPHFGFTKQEIEELLKKDKYKATIDDIESWYNGYYVGEYKMHNPYSVVRCLSTGGTYKTHGVKIDTTRSQNKQSSGKKFLDYLLLSDDRQYSLQELYCGHSYSTFITDHTNFKLKIVHSEFLSMLTFLGYLTARRLKENSLGNVYEVMIPNQEIRDFVSLVFQQWVFSKNKEKQTGVILTLNDIKIDLAKGNVHGIEKILNSVLPKMKITDNTHCEMVFALLHYSSIPWNLNRSFSDKEMPWDCVITLTPKKRIDSLFPVFITIGRKHMAYETWKHNIMEASQKKDHFFLENFFRSAAKNIVLDHYTDYTSNFTRKLFECSPNLNIQQISSRTANEGVTVSQQVFVDVYSFNEKSQQQENPTVTMTTAKPPCSKPTVIEKITKQESTTSILTFVKSPIKQQNPKPKTVLVGPPSKQSWKTKIKNVLKRMKAKILRKTSFQPRPIGEEQSQISSDALFSSNHEQSKGTSDELLFA